MSKQSEDDLLADEIEDEGEEDQINKDSLPDERNAVPAHASRQLQDKTAASSEEISQLTHAIGHFRILGIGLELACNGGSCGEYH